MTRKKVDHYEVYEDYYYEDDYYEEGLLVPRIIRSMWLVPKSQQKLHNGHAIT